MTVDTSKLTVTIDEQYSNCLSPEDRFGDTDISYYTGDALWKARQIVAFISLFMIFAGLNILCSVALCCSYPCVVAAEKKRPEQQYEKITNR